MKRREGSTIVAIVVACLVAVTFVSDAAAQGGTAETIVAGTLVGEKCVETGKLKPCPLEWAYPMVLFGESGTYKLALAPVGVNLWELDRAFGKRVAVKGILAGDMLTIRSLALLEPLDEGKVSRA